MEAWKTGRLDSRCSHLSRCGGRSLHSAAALTRTALRGTITGVLPHAVRVACSLAVSLAPLW